MDLNDVLILPLVTEKSQGLEKIGENLGKRTVKYSFIIHPDSNKPLVKNAIKKFYKVIPDKINIQLYRGKIKKFRNLPTRSAHWKKAIVTFENGANLEFSKE